MPGAVGLLLTPGKWNAVDDQRCDERASVPVGVSHHHHHLERIVWSMIRPRERCFHNGHGVRGPASIEPGGPCSVDRGGRARIEVIGNAVCIGIVQTPVAVGVRGPCIFVWARIIFVADSIQVTVVGTSVAVQIDGPGRLRRARIKRVKHAVLIEVLRARWRPLDAHDGQSEPDPVSVSAEFTWAVSWDDMAGHHLHGRRRSVGKVVCADVDSSQCFVRPFG
jgi:hypothetical protein